MSYFDHADQPIRHLDTAVQSALIDNDPQRAVTHLVKRYSAQMAGELRALQRYEPAVDLGDSPILSRIEDFEDIDPEPVYLAKDVTSILDEWADGVRGEIP